MNRTLRRLAGTVPLGCLLVAGALILSGCSSAGKVSTWPVPDSGRPALYYFGDSG